MRRTTPLACTFAMVSLAVPFAFGQASTAQSEAAPQAKDRATKLLAWDVVSVKQMPSDSCTGEGGIGFLPNGLSASCVPLLFVVENAYRLMDPARIVGLPEWVKGPGLYAINARVSGEDLAAYGKLSRDDQFRMLQPVLMERFNMKAHMEPREMPGYSLVIGKGGPKLKEPAANEKIRSQFLAPSGKVEWANAPLKSLTWVLSGEVGRPVVDRTGLTGKYDFTLEYVPAAKAAADKSGGPSVFTALEEQLGLQLKPAKELVEILVIDHIELPSPN